MPNITLIRHAETDWSMEDKHTGLTDIPLNTIGEAQAKKLKKVLQNRDFTHIFVSPLQRAQKTAQLAGILKKAIIELDLVEWDYGEYEGLSSKQIHKQNPEWNIFTQGAPGGESVRQATKRAERVIEKLDALTGEILLLSSGHFSRLITSCWLNIQPSFGNLVALYPASISSLGYAGKNRILFSWNNTNHLIDLK